MPTLEFNTIFTSDIRDSKGSIIKLVELTSINGNYETGGIVVEPEQFDLQSIEFISCNNFFAYPNDQGAYAEDGTWAKAVDLFPTQVANADGELEWRLILFLYATDGAELPDNASMSFVEQVPIRLLIMGSKSPRRNAA